MNDYVMEYFPFLVQENDTNLPLILYDLGAEWRDGDYYYFDNTKRPNFHGYIFQFTLDGQGNYEKEGKEYKLKEGDGFFIHLPENSRYYFSSHNEPWNLFFLHFDGPCAKIFYDNIHNISGDVFHVSKNSKAIRTFFDLFESLRKGKKLSHYEAGSFLYRFMSEILTELECPVSDGSQLIRDSQQYIQNNYATILDLKEVAEHFHVSAEYLSRKFRAETGETAIHYLTKCRIESAMNRLLNTYDSISEIATKSGFSNGNYFSKVFRRYTGYSPDEYRHDRLP